MDRRTFDRFRRLVYEKSGIALGPGKEALVSARVNRRLRALGIDNYETYLRRVTHDPSGEEIVQLLDAISTNVTGFFREPAHFEFLAQMMAEWLAAGQRRFRVWSAACSTGEEPYSIAITMLESAKSTKADIDIKILATDISTRVLETCRQGTYPRERLDAVPRVLRTCYFTQDHPQNPARYTVKDVLSGMIVFKRLNLSTPPFPMHGPLDVIFCRNVMIYFDQGVRARLLQELRRLLRPGGYLMVGHAESLTGMMGDFKAVRPSTYMKP
ncbi:MAG TPA: CheR family methyltransferase [Phycisphaerae bacterium]|nr:CheR family methyltransferase [Phycisphaerae bacterium]